MVLVDIVIAEFAAGDDNIIARATAGGDACVESTGGREGGGCAVGLHTIRGPPVD